MEKYKLEQFPSSKGKLLAASANANGDVKSYLVLRNGLKKHGWYNEATKQYEESK